MSATVSSFRLARGLLEKIPDGLEIALSKFFIKLDGALRMYITDRRE